VTRAADTAQYLQTFDAAFQSIIFQPTSPIDWVILHVTIGTRTTNVAMPETGTSAAAGPSYEIGSLPVLPGDTVVYSFTFSANGLAQDTPQFTTTLPASWVPTTFFTEASSSAITVVSTAPLAWADVHYTVNGGVQQNVRLAQQGSSYVQPLTLQTGDVLRYSATYSTGVAVFDTAIAQYTACSGPTTFVVDLGADSTTGVCVAGGRSNGTCNLRAALLAARASTGAVTIDLSVDSSVSAGPIEVTAGPSAILLESAPGGATRAIRGTATSRLFTVDSGATLTIHDASIATFTAEDSGGAISNDGSLDLEGVTLSGNTTTCSDTGAMTAFATCSGGAIASSGTLTLGGGTTITSNRVIADAATASFTTAWAGGGAVISSGTIAITGPVTFSGNSAEAAATSGYHSDPIGGASATAAGGAIYNTGTLRVTAPAGTCVFAGNSANASATTVYGTASPTSAGGAIENTGTLLIPPGSCVFTGNGATTGADIDSPNLLVGPWQFASSDVSPSNAYSISGDTIALDFEGYFTYPPSGYEGYTFQQPVSLVQGATYVLTVDVTKANTPIPTVVKASLSGAGAEQEQTTSGGTESGVLTFTFTVSSDPGSAPVIDLVAHPVLGQVGPLVGTGIGVASYDLTASLEQQ
jgi:hypothetical protein